MDYTILLLAILYKYLIGLFPYSGNNKPPMFGDFEAQRHWLEITFHLPAKQWYYYKLDYWGLDYPPLTAFHSFILGCIANLIDPKWIELGASEGIENPEIKLFMRLTSLATDLLILVPSIYYFAKSRQKLVLMLLVFPGLQVIDHGHFQYNSAMLGLALLGFSCMMNRRYIFGSIFFCCSLLFKQMALFYALPVFVFLLGICYQYSITNIIHGIGLLSKLGIAVVTTFLVSLTPFAWDPAVIYQITARVFPVGRGLYEDKVANFWCSISIVVKLRQLFDLDQLMKISICSTLLAVLPACIYLFKTPIPLKFIETLAISSLGFFMFSFQVHEKSILLPLLPITMLYNEYPAFVSWFNNIALFSLWPLLKKDGLLIPYIASIILWNVLTVNTMKQCGKAKFPILVFF